MPGSKGIGTIPGSKGLRTTPGSKGLATPHPPNNRRQRNMLILGGQLLTSKSDSKREDMASSALPIHVTPEETGAIPLKSIITAEAVEAKPSMWG